MLPLISDSQVKGHVENYLKKVLTYGDKKHYEIIKCIKCVEIAFGETRNVDSVKVVVTTRKHLCDYPEKRTFELIWDRQVGFFTEHYEC